jgi:Contact-dependent growth inhibition CdiA C-terminal domain
MAKYQVIVQTDLADAPKEHELSAALILADHFKADVIFLRPERKKTPDIDVNGTKWEIKSPTGNGKKTIDNNLRAAHKQSRHVVLDLRRAKLHQSKAIARINYYLSAGPHKIKHLKIITKTHKIIDIL